VANPRSPHHPPQHGRCGPGSAIRGTALNGGGNPHRRPAAGVFDFLAGPGWVAAGLVGAVAALALLSIGVWRLAIGVVIATVLTAILWGPVSNHFARRSTQLKALRSMPVDDFEMSIKRALTTLGYSRVHRPEHPHGHHSDFVDLRCTDHTGRDIVARCWRPEEHDQVGAHQVKAFLGDESLRHHPGSSLMITTTRFSLHAGRMARQYGIRRIEGPDLARALRSKEPRGMP
jgi:hypothetical protein